MNDIYTAQRQRWIRRQHRAARAYDLFKTLLIILGGLWLISCNVIEGMSK